ncbi:unnamed protein product, partial [Prorocentrum cordatum]
MPVGMLPFSLSTSHWTILRGRHAHDARGRGLPWRGRQDLAGSDGAVLAQEASAHSLVDVRREALHVQVVPAGLPADPSGHVGRRRACARPTWGPEEFANLISTGALIPCGMLPFTLATSHWASATLDIRTRPATSLAPGGDGKILVDTSRGDVPPNASAVMPSGKPLIHSLSEGPGGPPGACAARGTAAAPLPPPFGPRGGSSAGGA